MAYKPNKKNSPKKVPSQNLMPDWFKYGELPARAKKQDSKLRMYPFSFGDQVQIPGNTLDIQGMGVGGSYDFPLNKNLTLSPRGSLSNTKGSIGGNKVFNKVNFEPGLSLKYNFQQGGSLPKYQVSPTSIPTRQDSINLLENSLAVQDYYGAPYLSSMTPGIQKGAFKENKEARDFVKQMIDKKVGYGVSDNYAEFNTVEDRLLKMSDYYKKKGPYTYEQRESNTGELDLNAPMQLFDTRITPTGKLSGTNIVPFTRGMGDIVSSYTYDPISVTPWNMLSTEQKKERVEKYGTAGTPKSKTQTTNQKKPIYVTDPNDPRLKAYKDSSDLYEYSKLQRKLEPFLNIGLTDEEIKQNQFILSKKANELVENNPNIDWLGVKEGREGSWFREPNPQATGRYAGPAFAYKIKGDEKWFTDEFKKANPDLKKGTLWDKDYDLEDIVRYKNNLPIKQNLRKEGKMIMVPDDSFFSSTGSPDIEHRTIESIGGWQGQGWNYDFEKPVQPVKYIDNSAFERGRKERELYTEMKEKEKVKPEIKKEVNVKKPPVTIEKEVNKVSSIPTKKDTISESVGHKDRGQGLQQSENWYIDAYGKKHFVRPAEYKRLKELGVIEEKKYGGPLPFYQASPVTIGSPYNYGWDTGASVSGDAPITPAEKPKILQSSQLQEIKKMEEDNAKRIAYEEGKIAPKDYLATGEAESLYGLNDPIFNALLLGAPASLGLGAKASSKLVRGLGKSFDYVNPLSGFGGPSPIMMMGMRGSKGSGVTKQVLSKKGGEPIYRGVYINDEIRNLPVFKGKSDDEILDIMGTTIPGATGTSRKRQLNQTLNFGRDYNSALRHIKKHTDATSLQTIGNTKDFSSGNMYILKVQPDELPFLKAAQQDEIYKAHINAWKKKNPDSGYIIGEDAKILNLEELKKYGDSPVFRTEGVNVIEGNFPQFIGKEGTKIGTLLESKLVTRGGKPTKTFEQRATEASKMFGSGDKLTAKEIEELKRVAESMGIHPRFLKKQGGPIPSYQGASTSITGYQGKGPNSGPYIIPSGDITMKGVNFPLIGTDNLGNTKIMKPGKNYKFPGSSVYEEPLPKYQRVPTPISEQERIYNAVNGIQPGSLHPSVTGITSYEESPIASGRADYIPLEAMALPGTPAIKGVSKLGNLAIDALNPAAGMRSAKSTLKPTGKATLGKNTEKIYHPSRSTQKSITADQIFKNNLYDRVPSSGFTSNPTMIKTPRLYSESYSKAPMMREAKYVEHPHSWGVPNDITFGLTSGHTGPSQLRHFLNKKGGPIPEYFGGGDINWGGVAGGAASGAMAGSAFGPVGTAVGGLIGGGAAIFNQSKQFKANEQAEAIAAEEKAALEQDKKSYAALNQFVSPVPTENQSLDYGGSWGGLQTPMYSQQQPMAYGKKGGCLPKYQKIGSYIPYGGSKPVAFNPISHTDSVRHQADKILQYEQLKGGPGGSSLSSYSDPKYMNMLMDDIYPQVNKIMPNASAMEKGEAMDFIFNAGWDKNNKRIEKDPRGYALQEYYRKYDPTQLVDGKWSGRKGAPYSFDKEYANTIGKLPENERRILMNKGRDWYYKNTYDKKPGGWYGADKHGQPIKDKHGARSPDYTNTWYGRIWNTNEFTPFNKDDIRFTHPSKREYGGPINSNTMARKKKLPSYQASPTPPYAPYQQGFPYSDAYGMEMRNADAGDFPTMSFNRVNDIRDQQIANSLRETEANRQATNRHGMAYGSQLLPISIPEPSPSPISNTLPYKRTELKEMSVHPDPPMQGMEKYYQTKYDANPGMTPPEEIVAENRKMDWGKIGRGLGKAAPGLLAGGAALWAASQLGKNKNKKPAPTPQESNLWAYNTRPRGRQQTDIPTAMSLGFTQSYPSLYAKKGGNLPRYQSSEQGISSPPIFDPAVSLINFFRPDPPKSLIEQSYGYRAMNPELGTGRLEPSISPFDFIGPGGVANVGKVFTGTPAPIMMAGLRGAGKGTSKKIDKVLAKKAQKGSKKSPNIKKRPSSWEEITDEAITKKADELTHFEKFQLQQKKLEYPVDIKVSMKHKSYDDAVQRQLELDYAEEKLFNEIRSRAGLPKEKFMPKRVELEGFGATPRVETSKIDPAVLRNFMDWAEKKKRRGGPLPEYQRLSDRIRPGSRNITATGDAKVGQNFGMLEYGTLQGNMPQVNQPSLADLPMYNPAVENVSTVPNMFVGYQQGGNLPMYQSSNRGISTKIDATGTNIHVPETINLSPYDEESNSKIDARAKDKAAGLGPLTDWAEDYFRDQIFKYATDSVVPSGWDRHKYVHDNREGNWRKWKGPRDVTHNVDRSWFTKKDRDEASLKRREPPYNPQSIKMKQQGGYLPEYQKTSTPLPTGRGYQGMTQGQLNAILKKQEERNQKHDPGFYIDPSKLGIDTNIRYPNMQKNLPGWSDDPNAIVQDPGMIMFDEDFMPNAPSPRDSTGISKYLINRSSSKAPKKFKGGGGIHPNAGYEVERGEVIEEPTGNPAIALEHGGTVRNSSNYQRVTGNKHSDPEGGPQMTGAEGGFVYSDFLKVPKDIEEQLKYLT